jgi:hypothetical protein
MKFQAKFIYRLLAVVVGLLVIYCISFFHFIHSHETLGIRAPGGRGTTEEWLTVLDTKMNRLVITFYAPMFNCFFENDLNLIEWKKPDNAAPPN